MRRHPRFLDRKLPKGTTFGTESSSAEPAAELRRPAELRRHRAWRSQGSASRDSCTEEHTSPCRAQVVVSSSTRAGRGSRNAEIQPTTAKPPTTTSAVTNGGLPRAHAPTSTDPAIATPSDDPRFDALRDTPEMSPWTFSGHADCTTFTEAVSMAPRPKPIRKSPGQK